MLKDLLGVVLQRRSLVDGQVNAGEVITVHGADITARDNVDLAESGGKIGPLFEGLYQAGLIDAREYLQGGLSICGRRGGPGRPVGAGRDT